MAILLFGTIQSFDRPTYTAGVEMVGYPSTVLEDVPVAWQVREDLAVAGARCVVLFEDGLDPRDAVVLALYGGRPADDPAFDPVLGHRHRGLLRDGPEVGDKG